MKLYDISVPISAELPVYPGDPPVRLVPVTAVARGDGANVTRLEMSSHCGTHLDVPRHLRDDGLAVDRIPLERLVGSCLVAELAGGREIGRAELAHLPLAGEERVLLKTGNSRLWSEPGFTDAYAALTHEGAACLVEAGVQLVGIDYLSVEPFSGDGSIHRALLEGGVLILEGLNLADVPPGHYELLCLPLCIRDGDGAPARVLLRSRAPGGSAEFDPHTSRWPLS